MAIDFELVKNISHGALSIVKEDNSITFHRFTDEQRKLFESGANFWLNTFAASCVRLEFITDAQSFTLGGFVDHASSRKFYFFDIYVNGALIKHVGSFSYLEKKDFHFEVDLPKGNNQVAVYFPNLVKVNISDFELKNATVVTPVAKSKRIICYGDSITQGYDAQYPSLSYANLIADHLDAEVINKGIGGMTFPPALAAMPETGNFDLVIAFYGTNDWNKSTRDELADNANRFYETLRHSYPDSPICAILPFWRRNHMEVKPAGTLENAREIIRAAAKKISDVTIVDGWNLLPHLESCVSDGLHPNDFGFQIMARNLAKVLPEV